MAGCIHISSDKRISMGSVMFDLVVDLTRERLLPEEMTEVAIAFQPIEECFDDLGLDDLSRRGFSTFVKRCEEACNYFEAQGSYKPLPQELYLNIVDGWREMLGGHAS